MWAPAKLQKRYGFLQKWHVVQKPRNHICRKDVEFYRNWKSWILSASKVAEKYCNGEITPVEIKKYREGLQKTANVPTRFPPDIRDMMLAAGLWTEKKVTTTANTSKKSKAKKKKAKKDFKEG